MYSQPEFIRSSSSDSVSALFCSDSDMKNSGFIKLLLQSIADLIQQCCDRQFRDLRMGVKK